MYNKITHILLIIFSFIHLVSACTNCYIPVAFAGEEENYYIGCNAILDGTLSYDPEEASLTYLWTPLNENIILDDPTSSTPSFFTGLVAGSYSFSLIVNDGEYDSDPSTVTITVVDENDPPSIDVETSITVNKNSEFTLDASLTNDASSLTGLGLIFEWIYEEEVFTLIEDNISSITLLAYDVENDENHNITLNVDDGIDTSTESISITIISNQKPVAVPGEDQIVKLGTEFTLDGSASYDPDGLLGENLIYTWGIPNDFTVVSGDINSDAIIVLEAPTNAAIGTEIVISLTVNDGTINSEANLGEDVFISEYCDHPNSANVRYFEIYNPTANVINLNEYALWNIGRGGIWPEQELSLSGNSINPGESILITRKGPSNSTASQYIDFNNINYIEWSDIDLRGDDAVGIAKNNILLDAIGGLTDPGQGWDVGGYVAATKDAQLLRKNSIVGGNINSTCMITINENEDCWNLSRGSTPEDSEWIYLEDATDGDTNGISDVDSWNNAGYHYCAVCDNYLTITLTDNAPPTAAVNLDFELCDSGECDGLLVPSWEVFEGSTILLDASFSSDPEGATLTYNWESALVEFSDHTSVSPTIVIPENVADNFINDIVLTVSDGVGEDSIQLGMYTSSENSLPVPLLDFVSMSNGEFSYSMNSDLLDLCIEDCASDSNCLDECNFKNIILDNQTFDLYEGYDVLFTAKNSYDLTYTGGLLYSWEISASNIELEGTNTSEVSFIVPEYLGQDQTYKLTLTVDDGIMSASIPSESAVDNITFLARMPILSISDDEEGNKSEGDLIRFDASDSNDPLSSDLNDLHFTITSSPSLDIIGHCYNNEDVPCDDATCDDSAKYCLELESNSEVDIEEEIACCEAGCANLSTSQQNTCIDNCNDLCGIIFNSNNQYEWTKCARNKSIGYAYLDKSIGEIIDYTVDFKIYKDIVISDDAIETLVSETDNIEINVQPEDPVPNAGYRYETTSTLNTNITLKHVAWYNDSDSKSITENTQVSLDGTRSYDPNSEGVFASYWSDDDTWETPEDKLKIISFYDETVGLKPKEGYTYTWEQVFKTETCEELDVEYEIPDFHLIKNEVNPSFLAPSLIGDDDEVELTFSLVIADDEAHISDTSSVSINIVKNEAPVAVIGDYRNYNDGELDTDRYLYGNYTGNSDAADTLRAIISSEFTLIGKNSYDNTPYQALTYLWTASDNTILSDATNANPTFTVPSDLCSDKVSLNEIDCCEDNEGSWTANQVCANGTATWTNEKELNFNLLVNDGQLTADVDITFIYSSYSVPDQPSLYATSNHGEINLYWDNVSQNSIDDLTRYADFEGYKIYKSTDYGQTWGDAIFNDGEVVGWKPYVQYDLSAEQDSTYCLYKNDFLDCMFDDMENLVQTGAAVFRYDDVSDNLDWYEGYYWQDLGNNSGLTQSYVDEDVIDGVDYTYCLTAYDRGTRPDTLQYGHFGELSASTFDENKWVNEKPVYTFTEEVVADSFYFYKMNYNVLESYISEDGSHMFRLEVPSEWNVGETDEVVSQDQIDEGVKIWDTNIVWPMSNPDEFPYMYSLESKMGSSVDDMNFVTVSPGFYASNVSFPDEDDLDEFIAADCEAIGDGNRFYEIINESDLKEGYIRLEIQADPGSQGDPPSEIFENFSTENACLYAFRVQENVFDASPNQYVTLLPPDGETSKGYLVKYDFVGNSTAVLEYDNGGYNINGFQCNGTEDEGVCDYMKLNVIIDNPGVSVETKEDCTNENGCVYIPDYLIECHTLSYLDDLDLTQSWTEFFDGVRMRFDNSLRNEPKGTDGAALKDIYSYPDSTFAQFLTEDAYSGFYGEIILKYAQGAFAQKPSYEYEIEFSSTTFPDTAKFNTTGGSFNDLYHLEECGSTFGTLLPFKVKNLTTGKYVKLAHTDNGIWNQVGTDIPPWFTTPDDPATHPGYGDCIWSPGEWLEFKYDDVQVGDDDETEEIATFILQLSFNGYTVYTYKSDLCPNILEYDQTETYPSGTCVTHAGNTWYAEEEIKPSDNNGQGFSPNEWYDDNDLETELNANPWKVIYPWSDGDKLVIKPQKWFVDGDYWIADMSMLGASDIVTKTDLSEISVVPNPYIISSQFNESTNSNRIRFTHLPQKCDIEIYTVSGEFVDKIEHDDNFDGNEYWDLKNSAGKKVSPGLYIYVVESDNGLSKIGKFAVVR